MLLTQFRGDVVAAHQYSTARIDRDGDASLEVRAYVLPDSDRLVVDVQSRAASETIEVKALELAVSTDPLVEGAMSDVASAYLDRALRLIVDGAVALDPARAPSLLRESRAIATGATTVEETHGALRHALAVIDDRHSQLLAASEVRALNEAVPRPPYGIERTWIDTRIGYIRIPAFNALRDEQNNGYAYYLAGAMRQVGRTSTGRRVDGLVVDLRSNEGGSFVAMLEGVCGWFDGRRPLGGLRDRTGHVGEWTCAARSSAPTDLPVAVLVGPRTASAGEMLAIAFRGRRNTVLIGEPTRGLTTGIHLTPLGDGALLALATSVSVDAVGNQYRAGVVPDIQVSSDAPAIGRPDRSINEAVAWIDAHATTIGLHAVAGRARQRQRVPVGARAAPGISKSG